MEIVRFDPARKRDLVGPGGAVLKQLEDRYGVSLDLSQEGQCLLYGNDAPAVSKAKSAVQDLVADVVEGEVYQGTIIEIKVSIFVFGSSSFQLCYAWCRTLHTH